MGEAMYSGPAPETLIIVEVDGVSLLYHRSAGATHVVTEPLPQIVAALAAGPANLDGLLDRLGLKADEDNEAQLAARLEEMEASGLISRQ
jgi:PqqD family protein of HPr-rel-A system